VDDQNALVFVQLLSCSGPRFSWREQIPTAGGGWRDGPRNGSETTDPAYEERGEIPDVLPCRVIVARDADSGRLLFDRS
jgi:hypothetical protein